MKCEIKYVPHLKLISCYHWNARGKMNQDCTNYGYYWLSQMYSLAVSLSFCFRLHSLFLPPLFVLDSFEYFVSVLFLILLVMVSTTCFLYYWFGWFKHYLYIWVTVASHWCVPCKLMLENTFLALIFIGKDHFVDIDVCICNWFCLVSDGWCEIK